MARQLPAIIPSQRSLSRVEGTTSTVSRVLAAVAPDLIRAAERLATNRKRTREQAITNQPLPEHTEAIHVSEVEIDIAMPFVRKVTMRNMTAWQNGPAVAPQEAKSSRSGLGIGRKIGLIGASSVIALCLGVIARRISPFSDQDGRVIDVVGKPKS
ncbi:MAG: hypothetical protein R3A46_20905 [Thermomicrobiales bacterium]